MYYWLTFAPYLIPNVSRLHVSSQSHDRTGSLFPLLHLSHVLVASLVITGGMGIDSRRRRMEQRLTETIAAAAMMSAYTVVTGPLCTRLIKVIIGTLSLLAEI